jgi:ubiquitin carboxyl-terminal hydrolase 14
MVKVTVKWNKQVFSEVDLDPSDSVETFKTQLWTLTSVPVERQKLMAKGGWKGILKDEPNFSGCTLSEGLQIMLMGSADVLAKPKVEVR